MKKNFFSILVLGFVVGGLFAGLLIKKRALTLQRTPASLENKVVGKHHSAFDIKLQSSTGLPPRDNQDFSLAASVFALQAIQGNEVHYKWVLPDGVSLVSGQIEDSIPTENMPFLGTGKAPFSAEIVVQGFSSESEPKVITFQIYSSVSTAEGDVRIGSVAVFSNRTEAVQQSPGLGKVQSSGVPQGLPKTVQQ